MADKKQHRLLHQKALTRNDLLVSIVGIVGGGMLILIALRMLTGIGQTSMSALGSAILGAGALSLLNHLSLKQEFEELSRSTNLGEALREAFRASENAREDCLALGIRRIFSNLSDLQSAIKLDEIIQGARYVYILGTTVSRTVAQSSLFTSNPGTEFRFIFVDPDRLDAEIEAAMHVIHDISIRMKASAAEDDLKSFGTRFSNVKYKKLQFVPTFSAILVVWEEHGRATRGWLQIDSYLLRTRSDGRLWIIMESEQEGSRLFERYRNIVQELWDNPVYFDVRHVH